MCGKEKEKGAMSLEVESSTGASRRGKKAAGTGSGQQGVPAGKKKPSVWTGVRLRHWGRWAAEIRVPHTREKLWIGTFETDRQAALAYDAAVFYFYGEKLPKTRKVNFPEMPRPEIPSSKHGRHFSFAKVKMVAEKHVRDVHGLLPPLPAGNAATTAPDMVGLAPAPAPVLASPPAVVDATSAPDAGNLNEEEDDFCMHDDELFSMFLVSDPEDNNLY